MTVEHANTTDSRRTMCNLWPDFDVVQVVIQVFCHCNYHPMYRSKPFLINHCGVSEWKSSSQVEERMIQWISSNTYLHLQRCANYIQLPDETLLGVWTWIYLHIFTVHTNVPQPEMKLNDFLKIYCWWSRNPAPPGMYKNLVNNGKKPPTSTGVLAARHVGECGDPPEATRRWKSGPLGDMVLLQNHVETTVFSKHVVERVHRNLWWEWLSFNSWLKMNHDLGTVRCRWGFPLSFLAPYVHWAWMDAPVISNGWLSGSMLNFRAVRLLILHDQHYIAPPFNFLRALDGSDVFS